MYKACFFDLDGTLVNSLQDLADSCNSALFAMGFPIHDAEAYKLFVGNGVEQLIKNALPKEGITAEIVTETRKIYGEIYALHYLDKTKLYDGITELISYLKAKNVKLAVVSNKPDDFTKKIIAKLFGGGTFDVVAGQKEGIPHKPSPQAVLDACLEMGLQPRECVFIGDSAVDMKTAIAAGMLPVGVLWGFRAKEELENAGAKYLIEKPTELKRII